MVKREERFRRFAFIAFALMVMMLCWETNRSQAAIAGLGGIPQQSIRLRILANSDTIEDQWIKRKVRDAVVEEMNRWVAEPQDIEQAREAIRDHLPEIRELIGQVLAQHGFRYGYSVQLGVVPFPTKMYGDRVYPAGDYEALRVTLGEGKGQNWWCVLFPPLCFVDAVTGEAVAKDALSGEQTTTGEKDANDTGSRTGDVGGRTSGQPGSGGRVAESNASDAKHDGESAGAKSSGQAQGEGAGSGASNQAERKSAGNDGSGQDAGGGKKAPLGAASNDGGDRGKSESAALRIQSGEQVHFFVWDMLKKLFSTIETMFA